MIRKSCIIFLFTALCLCFHIGKLDCGKASLMGAFLFSFFLLTNDEYSDIMSPHCSRELWFHVYKKGFIGGVA